MTSAPQESPGLTRTKKPRMPPIIVDTREQLPYFMSGGVDIERRALSAADYSLVGFEPGGIGPSVGVERKSLGDLIGCVSFQRERFERELAKLAVCTRALILVEADIEEVLRGEYRSKCHPNAIIGSTLAWWIDYRTPTLWAGSRVRAERLCLNVLLKFWQRHAVAEVAT